jgi:hypothetical protein
MTHPEILTHGRKFELVDDKKYALQGTKGRFIHMATVRGGLREFVLLQDQALGDIYLNEITAGGVDVIEDDELFKAVYAFLLEHDIVVYKLNEEKEEEHKKKLRKFNPNPVFQFGK